jgi:ABC-type transporter Mla subunit MlaD
MALAPTPASSHAMPGDCTQGRTFDHILTSLEQQAKHMNQQAKTLDRLEDHSERTVRILEKMGENSATIEAHTRQIAQHDTAFIELFNWRRDFIDKQEGDYRANVGRLVALEKAQAVEEAVDHVIDKVEEKAKKAVETKVKFWTDVKLALLPYIVGGVLFALWLIDRLGIATAVANLFKEMEG